MHLKDGVLSGRNSLLEGFTGILGILVFAIFIQRESSLHYFAYVGLLVAAYVISLSIRDISSLKVVLGFVPVSCKVLVYTLFGLVIGSLLAILNNHLQEESLLPPLLTRFALIAPLIGIMEELVFRGYVQTKMAPAGTVFSILIASAGHAIYKYIVIKTLPEDIAVNFTGLILLTFLVGIVFGYFRERSGSIYPAAMAHAVFDIIIYGGSIDAPLWVWG